MKRNTLLLAFTMALLMVGSAWASTTKHSTSVLRMSGKIVTVNNSQLTLTSKVKGKSAQETFVINPQTKKMGTLNPGERALVRYKNEKGQKIATLIRVHKPASASSASSKTK